jgi:hypothetical protein
MRSLKMKLSGILIGVISLCMMVLLAAQPAYAATLHTATSHLTTLPATASENCAHPANKVVITFKTKNNTKYCFSGTGYLGYRIANVQTFTSSAKFWVRVYPNNSATGCFLNEAAGAHPNTKYFDGKHTITQIDINAVHSAPVCA